MNILRTGIWITSVSLALVSTVLISPARADLVGLWEFENGLDLTAATTGTALALTGTDLAVPGSGGSDTGATQLDVDDYYTITHGIAPNGGGAFVNQFSILWDVMYPASSAASWKTFYQTNVGNGNDGELFIRPSGPQGAIGVGDMGYSTNVTAQDTWYRVVLTMDNAGAIGKVYVDGVEWLDSGGEAIDGRFSLDPTFHIFADNDGDDALINSSNVALWDEALSSAAVATLGGAGDPIFSETPNLTLKVNTDTGQVSLNNDSPAPFDIEFYEILSDADSLNPSGWYSLSERNLDPVDGGDEPGETWDEAGGSGADVLSEAFLQGSSAIAIGDSLSLGHAYDESVGSTSLEFNFGLAAGGLLSGNVEYVSGFGDMNGDGSIDDNDVNAFVLALTDRAAYEAAYPGIDADIAGDFDDSGALTLGDVAGFKAAVAGGGSSSATSAAVPEPSALLLAGLALCGLTLPRRRRLSPGIKV